jgi:hypothetical protein
MKYQVLRNLAHNGHISLDERSVFEPPDHGDNQQAGIGVKADLRGLELALSADSNGAGMWVPYIDGKNVYGFFGARQLWAASGPYSGCHLEVGICDGRFYAAHLSRGGGAIANDASWEKCEALAGKRILFTRPIMFHDPGTQFVGSEGRDFRAMGLAAITFVHINWSLSHPEVEVTQLDVRTRDAGGLTGRIMSVSRLTSG